MKTIEQIKTEIAKLETKLGVLGKQLRQLEAQERHEKNRQRLKSLLGKEVKLVSPHYHRDFKHRHKVGTLLSVERTRCTVDWEGKKWSLPIDDIIAASEPTAEFMAI